MILLSRSSMATGRIGRFSACAIALKINNGSRSIGDLIT